MSEGLRHRFSLETNNLGNFSEGSVYERCFQDYERILEAQPLCEYDLSHLNSEQSYGSMNFKEYYPSEETSFIETGSSVDVPPTENTPLIDQSNGGNSGGNISSGLSNMTRKDRPLGPPPHERPNWSTMNEDSPVPDQAVPTPLAEPEEIRNC
ncbi:uncharacterized protein TNCV_4390161 [Trichonephila clavipes]|nr:uncharacterized protein TNCV_4390161 [Trichonephila clavipes]